MAKGVDITEKLSFDENPKIIRTMLEIMGLFSVKSETQATIEAYTKLFSEKDRKKIDKLNLPFKDFIKIIEIAMNLVSGEEDRGEQ